MRFSSFSNFSLVGWLQDTAAKIKDDYLNFHTVVAILCVGGLLYLGWPELGVSQPPGILVPRAPIQGPPYNTAQSFPFKSYQITPLADYDIAARVLAKQTYFFGREADIAPVDLTLGWQDMSDTKVLQHYSFRISQRWSSWKDDLPDLDDYAAKHSANTHMIPATKQIEQYLRHARVGQLVHLKGVLVQVRGHDGYSWTSSLTRDDTGWGACELMYVQSVEDKIN